MQVAQILEITQDMDMNVQQCFLSFETLLKKTLDAMQLQQKIYCFQMAQRNHMYEMLTQKYAYAKKECIKNLNKNKELMKQNKMMKDFIVSLI